jgi:hypothetical protein
VQKASAFDARSSAAPDAKRPQAERGRTRLRSPSGEPYHHSLPVCTLAFAHTGRVAREAGEKVSAQPGRITELNRGEVNLGPLLENAEKWNQAELSPATRGPGKDKLPVVVTSGSRSTAQHLSRLTRVAKEFDTTWHGASGNVVVSRTP